MKMRAQAVSVSNRRVVRRPGAGGTAALALATIAALVPLISGCAGRSPAEAENREIRVRRDAVAKYSPRFSPDGTTIAYGSPTMAVTLDADGYAAWLDLASVTDIGFT